MINWWNIRWWFWHKSWIYINTLTTRKCYREWREVKKFIKKPHWHLCSKKPWRGRFTILRLEVYPLEWKTKYGEYRWEDNPSISLSLFGRNWRWSLIPNKDENGEDIELQYWETIMWLDDYLGKYDEGKAVKKAIKNNTWSRSCNDNTPINAVCMLTDYGKDLYAWETTEV